MIMQQIKSTRNATTVCGRVPSITVTVGPEGKLGLF
jgi:hypothetical protein